MAITIAVTFANNLDYATIGTLNPITTNYMPIAEGPKEGTPIIQVEIKGVIQNNHYIGHVVKEAKDDGQKFRGTIPMFPDLPVQEGATVEEVREKLRACLQERMG